MKKTYLIAILLLSSHSSTHAQTEKSLENTILVVVSAFKNKDNQQVQQHIHPKYGFVYWNKIGVPTNQSVYTQAEFQFPTQDTLDSNQWFYEAPNATQKPIQTSQLPQMDCQLWDKAGLYYKFIKNKPFSELSKFNQQIIEMTDQELTQQLLLLKPLEVKMVELQYVDNSRNIGHDLHLFFSQIDKKWYLSGFDNAGLCDA